MLEGCFVPAVLVHSARGGDNVVFAYSPPLLLLLAISERIAVVCACSGGVVPCGVLMLQRFPPCAFCPLRRQFPNKAVESLLAALKSGAASLPTGGGGRANGGGGDSSDEEYVAPKPKPKAKSRDDDLGSLYMSRKPTGEAASILNGGPPKPRPRPSARPAAAPAGDGGGMDESAFMAWRGGDGDAPAPSRPKPSTRVERTRVERAEEPAEGDDAPKKKKGWSVFSKKS